MPSGCIPNKSIPLVMSKFPGWLSNKSPIITCLSIILILASLSMIPIVESTLVDSNSTKTLSIAQFCAEGSIKLLNSTSALISCRMPENVANTHKKEIDESTLKVSYHMISIFKINFVSESCDERYIAINADRELETCRAEMDWFGQYGDGPVSDPYEITNKFCNMSHVYLPRGKNNSTRSVVVNNLLPDTAYHFSASVVLNNSRDESLNSRDESLNSRDESLKLDPIDLGTICTEKSPPIYPPQTDLSSYHLRDHDISDHDISAQPTMIDLFWRPVPSLLRASRGINYTINCTAETENKKILSDLVGSETGHKSLSVSMSNNESYLCEFKSTNNFGLSEDSSLIRIPRADQLLVFGKKFKFFVVSYSEFVYTLTWTNISEIDPRYKVSDTVYTIYWCSKVEKAKDCNRLDGLFRTNLTKERLRLFNAGYRYFFGLSIRTNANNDSSGIIWSDCIANPEDASTPLEVIKSFGADHNSVHLVWHPRCASMAALIEDYEIAFCQLENIDPCQSSMPKYEGKADINTFQNNSICHSKIFKNNFDTQTDIKDLKASTLYAIRLRYSTNSSRSNQWSLWSNIAFAHTPAHPSNTEYCASGSLISNFFTVLIAIIILGILYIPTKKTLSHIFRLFFQYKQASVIVPQRIQETLGSKDSQSEIGLKHWVNRFSGCDHDSLSVHSGSSFKSHIQATENEPMMNNVELSDKFDYISNNDAGDYIPSNFLQGRVDLGEADGLSTGDDQEDGRSEYDDVSVQSHPSLFNAILGKNETNEETK